MFGHLVKSILMYEAEIWEWTKYEIMKKCQDKNRH